MREYLKLTDFSVTDDGDVKLHDRSYSQWVTVEIDDRGSDWEYDGGEVTTLDTRYNHRLEDPRR